MKLWDSFHQAEANSCSLQVMSSIISQRQEISSCSCRGLLDVMRVDSGDGCTRHSVCYAAYGYMGDLMRRSERLRWLGPLRYTLAGAVTFLQGRSYSARIFYSPISG